MGGQLINDSGLRAPLIDHFEANLTVDEREAFFPLGLIDPFAIQQLDWLRGIEEGRDPETSGREGLYDLACAFAMLESSTLKRQVSLMEVLSGVANAYQAEIDAFYGLG